MKRAILILISVIVFAACKKDVGYSNFGSYPDEIGSIIQKNCAVSGCHNDKSFEAAARLNLSTWENMFKGSNAGASVIPYSSRFSSLCYFINTYQELGVQNKPTMPLNKTPLSYEEVKRIKDWIDAGAPDKNGSIKWSEPSRKKLYAVNQGCDVVTVIDSKTQLPIRYVDVGTKPGIPESPHQVRVSPDGKYWYVIFINSNVMQKFSCADDKLVGTIPLSPAAAGSGSADAVDWNTFVISSDSKRAYVVSWSLSGKVAAVDLQNKKLLHYLGGFANPHAVCLNKDETKLYVGAQSGNYITELDTAFTNSNDISLQTGIPVSSAPSLDVHDMILSQDGNDLLITCQKSNEVRVFNVATQSVTAIIATGYYPQEIVYSKNTNHFFVTCTYDSTTFGSGSMGVVSRINALNYSVSNLKCGFQPHGIAVDERTNLAYVLSRNVQSNGPAPHHVSQCGGRNGFMNFINLNSFTLASRKFELSVDPYFIYARP